MQVFEYRGARDLVYAEVVKDELGEDGYSVGEIKPLAGLSKIEKETESESETVYYDDVPAIVTESVGSDEITLSVSALELETVADITGQYYDIETGMFVEGERDPKYFAIGYKAGKTIDGEMYVWRFKGTFSIPGSTHQTKDNGTESNGQELKYTGINTIYRFKKTGKTAKAVNVDTSKNKCDITNFFDTIQTPDTLKAKEPETPPSA